MTGNESQSLCDEIRRGLGFTQEARMLAILGLDGHTNGEDMSSVLVDRLARIAHWQPASRTQLMTILRRDLIERPIRPAIHPEWQDARRPQLPAYLRPTWSSVGRAERWHPWLSADLPVLSGRLERLDTPELGTLVLLSLEKQHNLIDALAKQALTAILHAATQRERLTLLVSLGEDWAEALQDKKSQKIALLNEDLDPSIIHCLRRGLSRASSRAQNADHLIERFQSFVLAVCFRNDFGMEVRAMAFRWPQREGQRLLKSWRRHHVDHPLAIRYLRTAMLSLLSKTEVQ